MLFSAAYTVQNGATITVSAWPYLEYSADYADYRNLLAVLHQDASEGTVSPQGQLLADRVVAASVRKPEDREQLSVFDLGGLLEAIFVLNNLEDLAKKAFSLHARIVQAEQQGAREGQPPASTSLTEVPTPTSPS